MASSRAGSHYRGIRVTITQAPDGRPCVVSLSTKQGNASWDDWNLLFPAIRVPVEGPVSGYTDILRLLVRTIESLLEVEQEYR